MENNCVPLTMHGVSLRVPRKSTDFEIVLAGMNNPETKQYLFDVMPCYEDEELKWFDEQSKRKPENVLYAIDVLEDKPRYVGNIGLHRIDWISRVATTGTAIWSPEDWGKRIGTKAKMILLNYAFNGLNLRKICSGAIAFNERSINYSLACGYQIEGRLKQQMFRNGKYYDKVLLAIFREDFEPLWERFVATGSVK